MEASAFRPSRAGALPGSRRLLAALPDDRLVEQIRRGNAVAFEVAYDRHYRGILSFCRHMLGSREEAEDALQQTFVSAFNDLQSNDRPIRLKAWLYTIARNRCLSVLRARREQAAELEDLPSVAGLSEEVQQRADLRELLDDLRDLPNDQREALVLYEIGDLSQAEVAAVIGVEPVKVKALVFQARTALIENRDARAIPCQEIREQLATATGGELRRGPLRRHLKACDGCREYRDQVKVQRRAMAAILPVVPTLGLKDSVLASLGLGGGAGGAGVAAGGAAGAGAGAAGGGGGFMASIGGLGAAKLGVCAALAAGGLAGGGIAIERSTNGEEDPGLGSAQAAEPGGGSSGAAASGSAGATGGPVGGPHGPVPISGGGSGGDDESKGRDKDSKDSKRDDGAKDDAKGGDRNGGDQGAKRRSRGRAGSKPGRAGNRGRSRGRNRGRSRARRPARVGNRGNVKPPRPPRNTGSDSGSGGGSQPAPTPQPQQPATTDDSKRNGTGTPPPVVPSTTTEDGGNKTAGGEAERVLPGLAAVTG